MHFLSFINFHALTMTDFTLVTAFAAFLFWPLRINKTRPVKAEVCIAIGKTPVRTLVSLSLLKLSEIMTLPKYAYCWAAKNVHEIYNPVR